MKRLAAITCLSLAFWMLCLQPAQAGRRWRFTPLMNVKTTYNDDVQYLGKGDFEVRVSPAFKLEIDSERTEHTIEGTLHRYDYADIDDLDRTTKHFSLESIHQGTERLTLIGRYNYNNDYTLGTSEEETGEVAEKIERESHSLSGRAQYALNERTLVGLNYGYDTTQYAKDYVDTNGHSLGADIAWAATERLTLLGAVNTGIVESEFQDGGSGDYQYYGASGGLRYDLTEIYTLFGNVGHRWTVNELDTGTIDDTYHDSGWTFNGGLEWRFERSWGMVTYTRDSSTSLSGSNLDRDRVAFQHNYRTTERSTLQMLANMTQTESDGILSQNENRYWSVGSNWRYAMTEDHTFWIGWTHAQNENLLSDVENDRNTYYMRFEFTFPQEWTLGGARY